MDERRLEIKVGALVLIGAVGVLGLLWLMGELRCGADPRSRWTSRTPATWSKARR